MHFLHWLLPAQQAEDVFGRGSHHLSNRGWLGPARREGCSGTAVGSTLLPPSLTRGIVLQRGESLALGQPLQARFQN